ncbi:MAG: hypothetical protein CRN43_12405 [Candidatus Nephrothrix sp. EaCA]|nr:MAG: hypothetical protein CRN43_12405 [Candidatus Nephrothrix sp. EaCA]
MCCSISTAAQQIWLPPMSAPKEIFAMLVLKISPKIAVYFYIQTFATNILFGISNTRFPKIVAA